MHLLLNEISTHRKGAVSPTDFSSVRTSSPWFPLIEPFTGAWQRGITGVAPSLGAFSPFRRCVTLIVGDMAKLGVRLVELGDGIWEETNSPAFSPVLRKPNRYQTWYQFVESWMISKILHGNTYVLKVRDNRDVVVALYVLDPASVQTLVAPGAAIFYKLNADNLSTVGEAITVPAREIIHDRMPHEYHPLVGVPPVSAACLSGALGIELQKQAATFFKNGARPSGFLSAPGSIGKETAERLKSQWDTRYSGENVGKVAVLGDGLKFESIAMKAIDAQLVETLRLSAEMVCIAFGMPLFKVGLGQLPGNANVSTLNTIYFQDCLHTLIEAFESCLDDGLSLPANYGVELVVDNLLRMDAQSQMSVLKEAVGAKIMKPNEARRRLNLPKTGGGDSLWGQQQDHSLEALAKRDEMMTPDGALITQEAPAPPNDTPPAEPTRALDLERLGLLLEKAL